MTRQSIIVCGVTLSFLFMTATTNASSNHHKRRRSSKSEARKAKAAEPEPLQPNEVLLKMTDGSSMRLADGHETPQGFWYQRGGVTYLIEKDRIKTIEKGTKPQPAPEVVTAPQTPVSSSIAQPVWIYLVGGARFEADNASESPAGVWYSRGPMNIFIERSRVERVEREDLESIAKSNSSHKERLWTTGNAKIDALIKQNGARHGVDPYLIFCVMEQESHFSTRALSPKGARGLMQLMPGTGARFGVRNAFNPAENIAGGTRYLKQLLTQFNGRVDLVLASYNAGEGAVVKFGHRVPPYRETRDYVRKISYRYQGTKKPEAHHTAGR